MKNVFVAQSGGPTVAINASLAGVIEGAMSEGFDKVYGAVNGVTGILNDQFIDLTEQVAKDSGFLARLKSTPAMYLGSCRYKLPTVEDSKETYEFIFKQFEKYEVEACFYIGGNDSMDTVLKLSAYGESIGSKVRIMGVPKTIDNDLCMIDHTPGFGSAAKYIATTMLEVAHDTFIYALKSVTIVEIMGRDAGWLTASAALARNDYNQAPHLIYLPEVAFDRNQFVSDVKALLDKTDNVIIAISEGIHDAEGNYISATTAAADTFGHSQLSGAGKALECIVKDEIGCKVRSIEVNVLQRAAAHMQSATDINESVMLGRKAVEFAASGVTASMANLTRTSNAPYTVEYGYAQIANIANEAKSVPREWINAAGNDVTAEMIEYLRPLIMGETAVEYKDGLPVYAFK